MTRANDQPEEKADADAKSGQPAKPTDNEPTDNEPTDRGPADKEPAGEEPADEQPAPEEPTVKEPPGAEPPGDEDTAIDLEKLGESVTKTLTPVHLELPMTPQPAPDAGKVAELLEEMAEDMLHLSERLGRLEAGVQSVYQAVDALRQRQDWSFHQHGVAQAKLQVELASERKAFIARSTFNALSFAAENLGLLRSALDEERDALSCRQLDSILSMVNNTLQTMGFTLFEAKPGEEFDPTRMEVVRHAPGDEGLVVKTERKGYAAGQSVVARCGVVVGRKEEEAPPEGEPDEEPATDSEGSECQGDGTTGSEDDG